MRVEFPVYDICRFPNSGQKDILVSRFGSYLKKMGRLHFPHRHDFYHMVLFTAGGGAHSIDFEHYKVEPFQFYFMVPGQVHSWSFEGEIDGYVINFPASFFQSFLLNVDYLDQFPFFSGQVRRSVMVLPAEIRPAVIELLEKTVQESEANLKLSTDMIRVLILQLFLMIVKLYTGDNDGPDAENSYHRSVLRNFEKLIESNYLSLRLPKQYAGLLSITPNHLNALCNVLLGTSAGDMIRNRIALEAKRMLIHRNLTVKEIAFHLNFDDDSYFCKFFKKQAGMTPEEFRKSLAGRGSAL